MINESRVASVKHMSRVMVATVAAFILIICVFATSAFAGMVGEYNVVINDNGNEYTVTTEETEPIEILNEANIILGSNDRLDIAGFNAGEGGTIVIDRSNTVNIMLGDVVTAYNVYADTVGEVFAEIGFNAEGCTMNYGENDAVEDGMVISVVLPVSVSITADGETYEMHAANNTTIGDLLTLAGITLGENDYVEPSADTVAENGMEITVFRTEVKTITVTEAIKYSTETTTDDSLSFGETKVLTKGVNGEKEVTYEVTYVNGEETSKTEISSTVIKEAVTEVKAVGTSNSQVEPNGVVSKNGYTLGQVISGRYTHYCSCAKCCGKSNGVTASGKKVYTGMENPYYVACNWLPLGSVIDIDGTLYTVVDRGGSGLSKKGRVDIYTPEGHQAALKGGAGGCTITIVRLGW